MRPSASSITSYPRMDARRSKRPMNKDGANMADEIGPFDFIVCGAGTSGSVVAGRLAANPEVRVLLLEAGGSDASELVMNPNLWVRALGSELDWGFVTRPSPRLNGRAIPYSMG